MTTDIHNLSTMRRPRLLIRTARLAADEYRRDVHLPRLLGFAAHAGGRGPLAQLLAAEAPLDAARRSGGTAYSVTRHVELLSAIIAEQRIAREPPAVIAAE
ncbi:DUF6477 family protein [Roseivivax isoporae]|uniref:Uncharacterized protein n=1 Tax=Roseivivax isoporae LMG 25204 TaxID=1449351 RepID=X7F640_9RHOB|nr:DUF6477 family protein [Roseivivax isoporae]ETX28285.1 hypothetical protein RISW2_08280 [Roseivivax isoporae LMG 25204]